MKYSIRHLLNRLATGDAAKENLAAEANKVLASYQPYGSKIHVFTVTATGTIDLSDFTDDASVAGAMTKVYAMLIENAGENAATLGGAENIGWLPAGETVSLAADASVEFTDETGVTIASDTNDKITVTVGAGTESVVVVIIGDYTAAE